MQVEIIAEIANAHQGNPRTAAELARQAALVGSDAVKFQVYSAEELLIRSHSRFTHFQKQAFARGVWNDLLSEARSLGVTVYCDVFGLESLEIALQNGVDKIKIHSSDMGNVLLLKAASEKASRVLFGCGGCTMREIAHALSFFGSPREEQSLVLLYGFQSYPTIIEDSVLSRLTLLRQVFGARCEIGYMDHVDGNDPMSQALPLVALGMGAEVLEKHLTLNRAAKGVDHYSSLNPDEFADFICRVRQTEQAMGSAQAAFSDAEKCYREQVRKHWVATRPMRAGERLTLADMAMKRVEGGPVYPAPAAKLLDRELVRDVGAEEPLTRAHVRQWVWALPVARMRSSRLPGKATLDAAGLPALVHLFERLKQAATLDRIVFCTTREPDDDALEELAGRVGIHVHRGPTENVLARLLGALEGGNADVVIRVTGDDILVDPDYLDRGVRHHLETNAEYTDLKSLPSGTEVEIFDADLLFEIQRLAADTSSTEYLTRYVTTHGDQFLTQSLPVDPGHARDWRLTLDTAEDYEVISKFLAEMRDSGKALTYRLDDVTAFFESHPEVLEINAKVRQHTPSIEAMTDLCWDRLLRTKDTE